MSATAVNTQSYKCIRNIIAQALTDNSIRWSFVGSVVFLLASIISNLALPLLMKNIVDRLSIAKVETWVSLLLLGYGAIWTLGQAMQYIRSFMAYRIEQRITLLLGSKVLSHLYGLSHRYFTSQKPGAVSNIIRRAQRDMPSIILGLSFHVLPTFIQFICVIVGITIFYPVFYVGMLMFILIGFFVYTFLSARSAMKLREQANDIDRDVDGVLTDWISNYEAIKTFGRHDFAIQICNDELRKRESAEVGFIRRYSLVQAGQSLILGIGLSILTYCVGIGVCNHSLTLGDFVLFNGYIMQFISPISILGHVIQDIKKALINMKGVLEILSTSSDIQECKNPVPLEGSSFSVEFRNVSFHYEDRLILDNLSFRIEAGQTALVVGRTGAGKSTIAKLLLRLYDPTCGEILINDINVRNIKLDSLYKVVGWVPQESYLLNETILNNIRFARPDATIGDVERVITKAHLENLIHKLPNGINTIVGDRGIKLSGGEKQRLAIARLFLKNPGLCIFDESTSSLDKETSAIIQKNVEYNIPDATKIVITHRPYLANDADKVIGLKNHEHTSQHHSP